MEKLEQSNLDNFDLKGAKNESISNGNDKISFEEYNRPSELDEDKITSKEDSINIGKFKDVQSLFKAYNSLQSEFTKKSQRLSELENAVRPYTKQDEINKVVDTILEKYEGLDNFKDQIIDSLKALPEDEDVSKSAEANIIKLLAKNYKTPEGLISDDHFLSDYVYSNKEIKEKIIQGYLRELKSASQVRIATNLNSSIPATPPSVASTISEAGKIAMSIIKKN